MVRREDFMHCVDTLKQEEKLLHIGIRLEDDKVVIIYRAESDKYVTTVHDNFIEVRTKEGNYFTRVFIPFENIKLLEGVIHD